MLSSPNSAFNNAVRMWCCELWAKKSVLVQINQIFTGGGREIKCFEFLAWLAFKKWMRACQSGFLFSSKETFPPAEALLFSDAIVSKNAYMLQALSGFWLKNWSTWMSDSTFQSCILCNFEQGGPAPFYHNVQSEYQLGVPLLHQQSSSMMALLWIGWGTWSVAS